MITDTHFNPRKLTVELVDPPLHGTVNVRSLGGYHYEPAPNYNGPDRFTYRAFTGYDYSPVATDTITVNPVNDPPVAHNDSVTTTVNTPITINVLFNDSDIDGDALTITGLSALAHGTATIKTGTMVVYTPTMNYTGSDAFTYTISDGHGGTATATVTIQVTTQPNTAPTISNIPDQLTNSGQVLGPIAFTVNDVDTPLDTLTLAAQSSNPALLPVSSITFGGSGGARSITLAPTAGLTGTATITVTVGDGLLSNFDTFTLTVVAQLKRVYLPLIQK